MSDANLNAADLLAQIEALKAENENLKAAKAPKSLTCKVSQKGAVSVYGLGRWPVTLYSGQWERLLGHADAIKAFIEENRAALAVKE